MNSLGLKTDWSSPSRVCVYLFKFCCVLVSTQANARGGTRLRIEAAGLSLSLSTPTTSTSMRERERKRKGKKWFITRTEKSEKWFFSSSKSLESDFSSSSICQHYALSADRGREIAGSVYAHIHPFLSIHQAKSILYYTVTAKTANSLELKRRRRHHHPNTFSRSLCFCSPFGMSHFISDIDSDVGFFRFPPKLRSKRP